MPQLAYRLDLHCSFNRFIHTLTGETDIPISRAVWLHLLRRENTSRCGSLIRILATNLTQTLAPATNLTQTLALKQAVFMPSVFTTQVWIVGSETGANPFLMLLTAPWQHWNLGPPKLVLEPCHCEFRFWDGHAIDGLEVAATLCQATLADLHASQTQLDCTGLAHSFSFDAAHRFDVPRRWHWNRRGRTASGIPQPGGIWRSTTQSPHMGALSAQFAWEVGAAHVDLFPSVSSS